MAEFWWIAPSAVGAGALGWVGVRSRRTARQRRLGYDAARHELREARRQLTVARGDAKVARAELARVQADRTAARATTSEVSGARRILQQTQRDARAALAGVRAARARVSAARATRATAATPRSAYPLAQTMAEHDALTARWMEYETDAAKALAFPAMSDARHPVIAAHFLAREEAQHLRPTGKTVSAAEYSEYRAAVRRWERAFAAAEAEAWRQARAGGTAPAGSGHPPSGGPRPHGETRGRPDAFTLWGDSAHWQMVAQEFAARSADAVTRAAETAAAAFEARARGRGTPPADSDEPSEER